MDLYGLYKGAKRGYAQYQNGKRRRRFYRGYSSQYRGINTGSNYGSVGRPKSYRAFRQLKRANWQWGGMLGIEKKYFDSSVANQAFTNQPDWSTAGCVLDPAGNCLNYPVQGTTALTRVGSKYNITQLHVAGAIQWPAQTNQTIADSAPLICWAIVWDKQPNGATITANLVYQNLANVAGTFTSPMRNLQYSKRFKVLKQWTTILQPGTMTYDGTNIEQSGVSQEFDFLKNFKKPIHVETVGNAGSIADNMNCAFHVIGISTDIAVTISYNARVRFTDP